MEKDEFIRFLENKGINAKLEDGVVMILYDGGTLSPSEVYRKFNLAKKFAEENEYRGSLGIRKRKQIMNRCFHRDSKTKRYPDVRRTIYYQLPGRSLGCSISERIP